MYESKAQRDIEKYSRKKVADGKVNSLLIKIVLEDWYSWCETSEKSISNNRRGLEQDGRKRDARTDESSVHVRCCRQDLVKRGDRGLSGRGAP